MTLFQKYAVFSVVQFCFFKVIAANTSIFSMFHGKTTLQWISTEPRFAEFYNLIRTNTQVLDYFVEEDMTIFIPTNQALKSDQPTLYSDMGLYHMANGSKDMYDLRTSTNLRSIDGKLPKLWISISNDKNEVYVNNAKIVGGPFYSTSRTQTNGIVTQSIFTIDRVLDAIIRSPPRPFTAYGIFLYPEKWGLDETMSVSTFFYCIHDRTMENLFSNEGGNTYFIPINKGIPPQKLNGINDYSIKGHIVPNVVLFTRPTQIDFFYETLANDDSVYMILDDKVYVKSRTVFGNAENPSGDYLVEIVQSDIPVANGVVHLISEPLGTRQGTLKPFPYTTIWEKLAVDLNLSTFYDMAERTGLHDLLQSSNKSFTLFVPNDNSWEQMRKLNLTYDVYDADLLKRHLIISEVAFSMERLYAMSSLNEDKKVELRTAGGLMKVIIHKKQTSSGDVYYIQWYNKLIKVLRPNYECSDGIIHVIAGPIASLRKVFYGKQMGDGCC